MDSSEDNDYLEERRLVMSLRKSKLILDWSGPLLMTEEEQRDISLRIEDNKDQGLDPIPEKALKLAAKIRPAWFVNCARSKKSFLPCERGSS